MIFDCIPHKASASQRSAVREIAQAPIRSASQAFYFNRLMVGLEPAKTLIINLGKLRSEGGKIVQ